MHPDEKIQAHLVSVWRESKKFFSIGGREGMGMEAATRLEQKEMREAKTVEHKIPESLLGIGVRIEDNILCTENKSVNLTEALPRSIDEIENICS